MEQGHEPLEQVPVHNVGGDALEQVLESSLLVRQAQLNLVEAVVRQRRRRFTVVPVGSPKIDQLRPRKIQTRFKTNIRFKTIDENINTSSKHQQF